jgi:hypothetical protein
MDAIERWKRGERRGNYAMMMGGLLFVIVGFAAFSVDIGLITMSELQAQATADAASHAALVMFRETHDYAGDPAPAIKAGNDAAQWIIDHNAVGMGHAEIDAGYPEYGDYNYGTQLFTPGFWPNGGANAVRVEVSREKGNAVNLLLAPLLGVPTHDVMADSITAQQRRAVMLVQDMSCSMMDSASKTGKPGTGAIHIAREANRGFLDYLNTHPMDGDMLGIALFAQYGAKENGVATNTGTDTPWGELREIEFNYAYLNGKMNGICSTSPWSYCPTGGPMPAKGIGTCTHPGIAVAQARNQLATLTDETFFRAMVISSDGLPNCGTIDAVKEADKAWAVDINIWSIVFHNGSFDATYMKNLVRGVGFSQISPNATDLPKMFEEVAQSLPTTLVD